MTGDGLAYLITPSTDHVAVIIAVEDGGLRPRATLPTPSGPFSVVAADLSGDGGAGVLVAGHAALGEESAGMRGAFGRIGIRASPTQLHRPTSPDNSPRYPFPQERSGSAVVSSEERSSRFAARSMSKLTRFPRASISTFTPSDTSLVSAPGLSGTAVDDGQQPRCAPRQAHHVIADQDFVPA